MIFFKPVNLSFKSNQIKFTGLSNIACAPKTIYIRTMSGIGSNNVRENGAPVGIQAILETGHCRSFSCVGAVYSTARPNIQQKPLSAWQDEIVADGP